MGSDSATSGIVQKINEDTCCVYFLMPARHFSVICSRRTDNTPMIAGLHASIPYAAEWENERKRDGLTGLYNRKYTEELIMQTIRAKGIHHTLFMVDLDNFKIINDTLGHPAGDSILLEISALLQRCFDEKAIIGRVGGDEFLILSGAAEICHDPSETAQKIIASINTLMEAHGLKQSCSIGILPLTVSDLPFSQIYETVDQILYHAKNTGKSRFFMGKLT